MKVRRSAQSSVLLCVGILQMLAVALPSTSAEAELLTESALEGVWYGEPVFNGENGHLALRIQRDAKGRTVGMLSMLDIDVRDLPVGIVKVDSNRVTIGPLTVDYHPDTATLTGTIPAEIAPVHAIAFTLERVAELPSRVSTPPAAPNATPRWTFDAGAAVWGGLAISNERLFVGTDTGELFAIATKNGGRLWQFKTGGAIRSRPESHDGDLFVVADDGFAYRLASADGSLRWKVRLGNPAKRSKVGDPSYAYDSYASSPTLSGRTLFAGCGSDVVAIDAASGDERWRYSSGGAISTKPAVADGLVFVGSFDGKLHAIDADSGTLAWSHDFGAAVTSSPAVADGRIIVGSRSYDLEAFRTRDGRSLWARYYWFSWVESSPQIVGHTVYVGASDSQKLNAFDAASGKSLWTLDTGGSAWAQPAATKERVYVGSVGVADYLVDHRSKFWGVDRKTGKALWRFDLARPGDAVMWGFAASPAVDGLNVYAATLDGRVYAFPK